MFSEVSTAEKRTEDMDGLHECCLEIRRVAIGGDNAILNSNKKLIHTAA